MLPNNKESLKKEYYSWFNKNQPSGYKATISNAIEAIYSIEHTGVVNDDDVMSLKAALALPPSLSLGEYCCYLALKHKSVEDLILTFSRHSLASIRFNTLLFCFYKEPQKMIDSMLKQGLNDRSKWVREKAIDIICRLNKTYLKNDLRQRLESEKNTEIQQLLKTSYGLLEKGYALDPHRKNHLTIQLSNGGQTSIDISAVDLNDPMTLAKLEEEIDEIRGQYEK